MNRRNIALAAFALAVPITVGVTQLEVLNRSGFIGFFYFPAILLSVILGGGSRSPGPVPAWSGFIAYTLLYLVVGVVLYALLCEFYLLRRGLRQLPEIKRTEIEARNLTGESGSRKTLEGLGTAIKGIEAQRRGHWLLEKTEAVNLSDTPLLIGAKAIVSSDGSRPVKGVLDEFRRRLIQDGGREYAEATLARLKADAGALLDSQAGASSAGGQGQSGGGGNAPDSDGNAL